MSETSSSDDLELEPIRKGPSPKTLAFAGVLALAAVGGVVVNNRNAAQRKAEQLSVASDAWANLSRCLAGDRPQIGQIARKARNVELGVPARVARMPQRQRLQQWPYRCATYASSLMRALFDSKSDDRSHRVLAMFASQAATNLETGQLHTGKDDRARFLDELFATAEQAALPPPHLIASAPLPPAPVAPLSAPLLEAILVGSDNARVLSQDAVARNDLRVLSGTSDKNLCVFANDQQNGLTRARCTRLRIPPGTAGVALGASPDGGPTVYTTMNTTGTGRGELVRSQLSPAFERVNAISLSATELRGFLWMSETRSYRVLQRPAVACPSSTDHGPCFTNDEPLTLSVDTDGRAATRAWLLDNVPVVLLDRVGALATGSPDAGVSSDASPGHAPDAGPSRREGVLYAGVIGAGAATRAEPNAAAVAPVMTLPVAERGVSTPWLAEPRVDSCRTSTGDLAIVAYTRDDHALVLWHTPTGFSNAIQTEAHPGVIACDGDLLRIAWFQPIPTPTANTLTCTHTGCAYARAAAPDVDADPVIAPLGGKVLAAYTLRGGGGFRFRVAPLMDLAEAEDHVVFDDLEHEGLQVDSQIPVFVRGRRAVVWVTSKGVAGETYAFRIEEDGRFVPVRAAR
jgi:hypothetical protein